MPSISLTFNPLLQTTNNAGRLARRGTTGNYYCQGSLMVRQCGCDGYCGPNNGCMCVDCMRSTLESQKINNNYTLVNGEGRLVKVEGNLVKGCYVEKDIGGICMAPSLCHDCHHLRNTIIRYASLLQ
jgi:hypothetical protein